MLDLLSASIPTSTSKKSILHGIPCFATPYAAGNMAEIARAVHEVAELHRRGLPPGNLLILHAYSPLEPALRKALADRLGDIAIHDAKLAMHPDGAFCSLTTLAAATGLEAPVVLLLGISRLIESEDDPRLGETGRTEARRDHTRMIYMGLTRASPAPASGSS